MKKKVILITGASSGMGKAFALQLLKEGHRVYGAARRVEQMKELEDLGGQALSLDISQSQEIEAVVKYLVEQEGGIDVLINNAGYAVYGSVEETAVEAARQQFEVNLFGLGALTQKVIPHLRAAGQGQIINISSMGGKMYTPLGAWYHASKHALEGWSDALRLELKPFGIDVVVIEPGIIVTEFGEVMHDPLLKRSGHGPYAKLAHSVAEATKQSYQKGNGSTPEKVAQLVAKVVQKEKPRSRYAVGKFAKPMIFLRTYLGDRLFDKIVMSQV